MWFCGLNPPPLCVPKISQEMSMATLINGGYYVNMGKLMTNYLLKVYCTMNICAAISDLLHPSTESLLNYEAVTKVSTA